MLVWISKVHIPRWLPNTNEIDTNNMKLTCQIQTQFSHTQCKPYSDGRRWGSRWVNRSLRWVYEAFSIPTCWYRQRELYSMINYSADECVSSKMTYISSVNVDVTHHFTKITGIILSAVFDIRLCVWFLR